MDATGSSSSSSSSNARLDVLALVSVLCITVLGALGKAPGELIVGLIAGTGLGAGAVLARGRQ